MKLFLKIIPVCLLSFNLNAEVFSVFLENDVINGEDRHYTSGTTFTYLSNHDTNDSNKYDNSFYNLVSKIPTFHDDTKNQTLGMTYSQFAFTPDDLDRKDKIVGDLPYAGVSTLDFILYKWDEDFFHEYMITLGMVGPSTQTDSFQKAFHDLTGNKEPKGWNNQLKDDFLYNFSYAYGYRAFKHKFNYGKMDIVNNLRVDVGNYHRALLAGTSIRYGNNYPNSFNTIGRFLGSNENKLLNIDTRTNNDFGWAISYGLGYSYTDYFYVSDYDKSYNLPKIKDTLMQVLTLDTYLDDFVLSLTYKTSKFVKTSTNSSTQNWGGVSIAYLF